jgi:hypothetical protein
MYNRGASHKRKGSLLVSRPLTALLKIRKAPLAITTYRATGVSEGEIAFGEFLETNAVVRAV